MNNRLVCTVRALRLLPFVRAIKTHCNRTTVFPDVRKTLHFEKHKMQSWKLISIAANMQSFNIIVRRQVIVQTTETSWLVIVFTYLRLNSDQEPNDNKT